MKIKMELENVERIGMELRQLSRNTFDYSELLISKAISRFWQGANADIFNDEFRDLCKKMHILAEDVEKLSWRVLQEKSEWEEVDRQGALRIKQICEVPKRGGDIPIQVIGDYLVDKVEDFTYDRLYKEFKDAWEKKTLEEKKNFLQELQNRIADRYGWPRVLLVVDDLPDGGGDAKGLNLDRILIIDIDNVNNENPWRLIETTIHESRHQFQIESVNNYMNTGQIPDGMTQTQIDQWKYEFTDDHYISPDDNFSDYYRQAIETDARKYGDMLMKDVLEDIGNGGGGGSW